MREVSLPSTTAIPPPASIRFSSKSIAPCTWTSVAWSDRTHSRKLRRTWRRCPTGSMRSPCRNCIPIGQLRNRITKKKGHQHRQRPKSREETPTKGGGNDDAPPHDEYLASGRTKCKGRIQRFSF